MSNVIWQNIITLPTCHPSRLRMYSSGLDPIEYPVRWTHVSQRPPQTTSRSVQRFLQHTQTDRPRYSVCSNGLHLMRSGSLGVGGGCRGPATGHAVSMSHCQSVCRSHVVTAHALLMTDGLTRLTPRRAIGKLLWTCYAE